MQPGSERNEVGTSSETAGRPGKQDAKRLLPPALGAAAIVLLLLSLATPWWEISYQHPDVRTYHSYGLLTVCSSDLIWGYSCAGSDLQPARIASALRTTASLVVAGLATVILEVALVLWSRSRGRTSRWVTVLGAASIVLTLASPVYLTWVLPGATQIEYVRWFFGSATLTGWSPALATWGAGIGWYAAIAAFVCTLAANIRLREEGETSPLADG